MSSFKCFTLFYCLICALLLCYVGKVEGTHDVFVDETNSAIEYSGDWHRTPIQDELQAGGFNMYSLGDPSATATFRFTGVAVYIISSKWPYKVAAWVSIDGTPPVRVDLQDHSVPEIDGGRASVKSSVVAEVTGLDGTTEHSLVFSTSPDEMFLALDMIMFTALDAEETQVVGPTSASFTTSVLPAATSLPTTTLPIIPALPTETPSLPKSSTIPVAPAAVTLPTPKSASTRPAIATATSPSASLNTYSETMRTVAIAVGLVCGILILLAVPLGILLCKRRKHRLRKQKAILEPQTPQMQGYTPSLDPESLFAIPEPQKMTESSQSSISSPPSYSTSPVRSPAPLHSPVRVPREHGYQYETQHAGESSPGPYSSRPPQLSSSAQMTIGSRAREVAQAPIGGPRRPDIQHMRGQTVDDSGRPPQCYQRPYPGQQRRSASMGEGFTGGSISGGYGTAPQVANMPPPLPRSAPLTLHRGPAPSFKAQIELRPTEKIGSLQQPHHRAQNSESGQSEFRDVENAYGGIAPAPLPVQESAPEPPFSAPAKTSNSATPIPKRRHTDVFVTDQKTIASSSPPSLEGSSTVVPKPPPIPPTIPALPPPSRQTSRKMHARILSRSARKSRANPLLRVQSVYPLENPWEDYGKSQDPEREATRSGDDGDDDDDGYDTKTLVGTYVSHGHGAFNTKGSVKVPSPPGLALR